VAAQDQSGWTPLHDASQRGHLDLARFLVEHGANITAQDQSGSTPLHQASQYGHLDVARFLAERGASATARASLQIQPASP
jgi:serine/threonine-protein phosphatase 6 regulatory ankyrin repeat subunit B